MLDKQVTLFSWGDSSLYINSNEIRIQLEKEDINKVNSIMEETINNVEQINMIKFTEQEREDIIRKALDLMNSALYSFSGHKTPYITDLREFYIDKFNTEKDDIVFVRGMYRGIRVNKNEIQEFFKEKVLIEGARVSSLYCALGRIQLRRFRGVEI